MPAHFDKIKSPYNAEDIFSIVADVEKYPEFLPWVAATRVVEKGDDWFIADMVAKFGAFSQKYTSKVILKKPSLNQKNWEIDVSLVSGPFKDLKTNWLFIPLEQGGAEVLFEMNFKFKSTIFEKMMGTLFEKAVHKMTSAFESRVDKLLGGKK